jgi:alkanesulfonate monooxygenase SsuD/methylene tetrahydromethanopterin reductase-like flavin-dependent oxidoreductase (luciferase family)
MKGDEEVQDLKDKFDAAVAAHPEAEHDPEIMVLRHTYVHSPDDPEGWRPGAEAVSRFYRTFSSWAFGKKAPENGFLEPQPLSSVEDRPEFDVDALHRSAMIGTPAEITERLKSYEEMGYDEYAFWIGQLNVL